LLLLTSQIRTLQGAIRALGTPVESSEDLATLVVERLEHFDLEALGGEDSAEVLSELLPSQQEREAIVMGSIDPTVSANPGVFSFLRTVAACEHLRPLLVLSEARLAIQSLLPGARALSAKTVKLVSTLSSCVGVKELAFLVGGERSPLTLAKYGSKRDGQISKELGAALGERLDGISLDQPATDREQSDSPLFWHIPLGPFLTGDLRQESRQARSRSTALCTAASGAAMELKGSEHDAAAVLSQVRELGDLIAKELDAASATVAELGGGDDQLSESNGWQAISGASNVASVLPSLVRTLRRPAPKAPKTARAAASTPAEPLAPPPPQLGELLKMHFGRVNPRTATARDAKADDEEDW
jgi:hypothetical protein